VTVVVYGHRAHSRGGPPEQAPSRPSHIRVPSRTSYVSYVTRAARRHDTPILEIARAHSLRSPQEEASLERFWERMADAKSTQEASSAEKALTAPVARIRRNLWRELGFSHQKHFTITNPTDARGTVTHAESGATAAHVVLSDRPVKRALLRDDGQRLGCAAPVLRDVLIRSFRVPEGLHDHHAFLAAGARHERRRLWNPPVPPWSPAGP